MHLHCYVNNLRLYYNAMQQSDGTMVRSAVRHNVKHSSKRRNHSYTLT